MVFRRLMMILKVIDASSQGQFALLHIKYAIEVHTWGIEIHPKLKRFWKQFQRFTQWGFLLMFCWNAWKKGFAKNKKKSVAKNGMEDPAT